MVLKKSLIGCELTNRLLVRRFKLSTFQRANLQPKSMPIVSLTEWNQFLASHPNAHLLQTGEWGELKSGFGWKPVHIVNAKEGVQILFRKLPLGFTIGYIPKAATSDQFSVFSGEMWSEIDAVCKQHRAIFLKLELDLWEEEKPDTSN